MRRMLYALLGAAVLGACNSDDSYDPTVPTDLQLVKGDAQTGEAGTALPESLTVQVLNLKGNPVEGVTVQWFVLTGGGTLNTASSVTNATGVAQAAFQLGPTAGEQQAQAVSGSLSGSPILFRATSRITSGGGGGGGGGSAVRLPEGQTVR